MFIVIGIGCLECDIPSDLVGVFKTLDEAEEAKKAVPDQDSAYKVQIFEYQVE